MAKKNKRFHGRSNGFRESSSRENKYDQKRCFIYKKLCHFIADCPELQKDNFRNKVKEMKLSERKIHKQS